LINENAIEVDVYASVWMPRNLQVVPNLLFNVLDLGKKFFAGNAEKYLKILVLLCNFNGSGRNDIVNLIFDGGTINLEACLHRQALHAEQWIPQTAASVDLGLGVFALALKLENMAVSRCLFLIVNSYELRVVNAGDGA